MLILDSNRKIRGEVNDSSLADLRTRGAIRLKPNTRYVAVYDVIKSFYVGLHDMKVFVFPGDRLVMMGHEECMSASKEVLEDLVL